MTGPSRPTWGRGLEQGPGFSPGAKLLSEAEHLTRLEGAAETRLTAGVPERRTRGRHVFIAVAAIPKGRGRETLKPAGRGGG